MALRPRVVPHPRPIARSIAPHARRATQFPAVAVADYSSGRMRISPDLSRVESPTEGGAFDTIVLLNPYLDCGLTQPEEYYLEVTLITGGMAQIGAALVTDSFPLAQPFVSTATDGAGDSGTSIGVDLSRQIAFISSNGKPKSIKMPCTWCVLSPATGESRTHEHTWAASIICRASPPACSTEHTAPQHSTATRAL